MGYNRTDHTKRNDNCKRTNDNCKRTSDNYKRTNDNYKRTNYNYNYDYDNGSNSVILAGTQGVLLGFHGPLLFHLALRQMPSAVKPVRRNERQVAAKAHTLSLEIRCSFAKM